MLGSTISRADRGRAGRRQGRRGQDRGDRALPQQGVIYHGLDVMGGGSILTGLVLGAIGVFVIERDL
jgi:AGZA family xanthine/uracil permease-like MFS transporter